MSRAVAANRHNARDFGRFASAATLRAQQRALLAPASRWRKEWVYPTGATPRKEGEDAAAPTSGYKVLKWVKYDEGGELGEESEQPTEEQVTAAITGAQGLLAPTPAPIPGSAETGITSPSAGQTPATGPATTTANTPIPPASTESEATITEPAASAAIPPPVAEPSEAMATDPVGEEAQIAKGTEATEGLAGADPDVLPENLQPEVAMAATTTDTETAMETELEEREHDVRMAPELVGKEAEEARAVLGIGDPLEGGPPEIQ